MARRPIWHGGLAACAGAAGAWAARLIPELRRAVAVVGSTIVMSEPVAGGLTGDRLAEGEAFGDAQSSVHYVQMTPSGRILFGRGLGVLGASSAVVPHHFHDADGVTRVASDFRRFFPALSETRLSHAWSGPVERTPTHLPFAGSLDSGNIHYALGYSGNGVGPSALMGRVLASLATGTADEYSRCALTGGARQYLPPEPLRYLGGSGLRWAVRHIDDAEVSGNPPPRWVRRGVRGLLGTHTPSRLEPRLRRVAGARPDR